ncbi:MAG: bifunctional (p)ppGpp synthetase/guanosine-3',5'-bis(diphosphate) 3'-pyrophosphohydrolase [Bacteroidaceae bacterium]|jgi:GTP pyrophosphokinase|nr:bifunctional (p)ppGpp synthetase/guanosine-3',5'-bis(diphosphate) 3'-pyrophosphohydrolase [Bacteroidaceae bacterium]
MGDESEKELNEIQEVEQAYQHLIDTYLSTNHRKKVDLINKAFNFARQAHKGVRRHSGEPYIMHPIAVAQIACEEIGLGSTSICSALLHDVVEDTDYTVEDIRNIFGDKIALIVDGLTKISGGIFGAHASAQAENFKKLLLTMSEDIRVILIKIADRLHNMRTLGSMIPSKQYKIAGETLYIYAPLAHRLGLNKIKTELEDLSFKYEHPEEYKEIQNKLEHTREERDNVFDEFTAPIRERLDKLGFNYEIKERVKSPYSIWNKMQTKHVTFEEIYDILAVRIIFTPKDPSTELTDCFNIYVQLSHIYKAHPERLRDWLNHPKANGYQALHVTLMSHKGEWIEVQIRSNRMHEIAEQGFAAHWKYKEKTGIEDDGERELEKWMRTIKEILDDPQPNALDFLETIKLNLYAQEIFVFTPKGELKTMPQNSTVLDFAFSIHTFLGSHCIGAKVNHKLVPISHKLQSGDQIEILTSNSQHVQQNWIDYVATAKAKGKILAILRKEQREQQKAGEEVLTHFFEKHDLVFDFNDVDKLVEYHQLKSREELLQSIGKEEIEIGENDANIIRKKSKNSKNWLRFLPFRKKKKSIETNSSEKPIEKIDLKKTIQLNEETLKSTYTIAECCHPIPGDDVLGFIDENNHIVIHKRQCTVASRLKASFGPRILAAKWDTHKQLFFPVSLNIKGTDRIGLLNEVTEIVSRKLDVNIRKLAIEVSEGIFEGEIQLYVHDVDDVQTIIKNLKNVKNLQSVSRMN